MSKVYDSPVVALHRVTRGAAAGGALMRLPAFGSLFSGIGGFDKGLEQAGWQCAWQVENDRYCTSILERHWPGVKRYGDIAGLDPAVLGAVDLVCGGFPCQDLSVAGRRAGLAGERSSLFWDFVRVVGILRPAWMFLENVPGLFSSQSGRDFLAILSALDELGYGLAWRVLDSQYFGVAQRRRRVFVVGRLGKPCPIEVLFESESVRGDSAPSRQAGTDVAPSLRSRFDSSSRDGRDIAFALREDPGGTGQGWNTSYALTGHHPRNENEATYVIQDARGQRDKRQHGIGIARGGPSYILDGVSQHAVAFAENQQGEIKTSDISPQFTTGGGKPGQGYSAVASPAPDADGVRGVAGVPEGLDPATPDSPRYRALGNAVTVPVIEWIGRRILEAS